ncbi:MAG: glycosyltransferase family 2 protein [Faecousia sp.]
MSTSPLISVIIPVYNVEKYLQRCLDSVIEQTYKNLEVILIDDGSTDHSGEICDDYAAKDVRIHVIHQENQGVSAARNKGLDNVKGEYITFVDSDDYIVNDMIAELLRLSEEEHADIVIGGYYGIGVKGFVRWSHVPLDVRKYRGLDILKCSDDAIPTVIACCKLFSGKIWKNLRFPVGQIYEDSWCMPKAYHNADIVVTYPRAVYYYIEHEVSIMHHTALEKKACARLDLFKHLIDFYEFVSDTELYHSHLYLFANHYISYRATIPTIEVQYHSLFNAAFWLILRTRHCGSIKNKLSLIYRRIHLKKYGN